MPAARAGSIPAGGTSRPAIFNRLVNLYQTSGQFPEAFRLVDQRLARFPGDDPALYQLGKTAAISGERLEQGEARKALKRLPP
ncbi:MAG TPA: tetratricopeptide repeat protein [Gemmatimonadales bacterium]|nr:tetratricopeptide repeat protein [Gemmatimonadales bacterium]